MDALLHRCEDLDDDDPDYYPITSEAYSALVQADDDLDEIPQNYITVSDEELVKDLNRILDMLDDDDDVQEVYHNWDE